jgi:hypothetical protein
MFQMISKIIKCVSLPALLIASICSRSAGSYQLPVDFAICLGAVVFVQRAVRLKEYYWAAGFVAIAVLFSPLLLVAKIFLWMAICCLAALATLLAAFQTRPLPAA